MTDAPDYKNKSQTAFGVAIICLTFVAETFSFTRHNPKTATIAVLAILVAVFIGTTIAGINWHLKYKAQPRD